MSFFNKNISRKIANQKLETKLLLSTIGIDLLFLFFFLVAAFSIITSRYHKLLYQSMQLLLCAQNAKFFRIKYKNHF